MKYVKLFENFISKYELIKPLNKNGFMVIDNRDKCISLQLALIDMGYDWATKRYRNLEKIERINDIPEIRAENRNNNYPLIICWNSKAGSFNYQDMSMARAFMKSIDDIGKSDNDPREIAVFDDYFKFKTEFRGHKLKKFGV